MTFYQFVQGELVKRCSSWRSTKTQYVFTFPPEVCLHEVRFPMPESRQFNSLYGPAIESLARMMDFPWNHIDRGLAALAQAYDEEEAHYHAPFEKK